MSSAAFLLLGLAVASALVAVGALVQAWSGARPRRATLARLVPAAAGTRRSARPPLVALAGAGAAFVLLGPVVAGLVVVGALAAPAVGARWRAATAAAGEVDALPDVIDAFARSLRAGAPPRQALRAAATGAPVGLAADLLRVASAADRGVPLVAALDRWAAASALDGAELVATAVAVTSSSGGDPARALTSVGDTLRDRRALRREVRALSSQARMSALVIAVAPIVFALAAAGTDGATADFLLRSPLGYACTVLGVGLDIAGWWWMDRITRTVR